MEVSGRRWRASDLFRPGRRLRRLLVRWLLRLRLQLLLLPLLLFLLLRQVMPDHTARRRTDDGMMTGDVPGDTADDSTLDTPLGQHALGSDEECHTEQWCGEQRQLRLDGPRHVIYLSSGGWRPFPTVGTLHRQDGTGFRPV